MKTFTILGAGWLGAKLAENIKSDFNLKVSVRNEDKMFHFEKLGYTTYILNEYNFSFLDELLDTNYLFINYPPSKFDDYLGFLEKIYTCEKIKNIEKIIFISSTSIYPNCESIFDENSFIETPSNKIVFDAENLASKKSDLIFRVSALLGEDRIAGRRLSNKIIDFPKTKINFVHRNDVISATIFAIKNDLNGIFNLASKQHPSKEELYSFNAQKYGFEKPIFSDDKNSIERIIDGSMIENFGFEYKYFDAFNF